MRITDILDAQLDESTTKMVSASHSYTLERIGRNLSFNFANINLPRSVVNTDIGKGYVTFKVKPAPGYAVGDVIPNMASIYFDSNPPIETNVFTSEFVAQLNTTTFGVADFRMYPNPATDLLIVVSEKTPISSVVIYDALGKTVLEKPMRSRSGQIDIKSTATGMYFVKIIAADSESIKKLIIR